jgi:hypothetical protein
MRTPNGNFQIMRPHADQDFIISCDCGNNDAMCLRALVIENAHDINSTFYGDKCSGRIAVSPDA